jgi:hypothetical protein
MRSVTKGVGHGNENFMQESKTETSKIHVKQETSIYVATTG